MFRRTVKFSVRLGVLAVIVAVLLKLLQDRESPNPAPNVEAPRPPRATPRPFVVEPQPEPVAEVEPGPEPEPEPEPEPVAVVEPEPEPEPEPVAVVEPEPELAAERPARAPLRAELLEDPQPKRRRPNRKVPIDHQPAEKRSAMVSWVEPHGAVCPTSHPIKAKLGSKVFRKPTSPGYEASKPDRCYASEGAARRAGFREAQR